MALLWLLLLQVLEDVTTKGQGWIELRRADAPHDVVVKAKMETSRVLSTERYRELWERTHVYNKGHLVDCDLRVSHVPYEGPLENVVNGGCPPAARDELELGDPTNSLMLLQL